MLSLDKIVFLIGALSVATSLGCSGQSHVRKDQADYGLYFTPDAAPKPVARPVDDGLSQILQIAGELRNFQKNGGCDGRQVLSTFKMDRQAGAAMMAKLEPYVARAHKALHSRSQPYIFDPYDTEMVPGHMDIRSITALLTTATHIRLAQAQLTEANQDLEDLFLFANLLGTLPTTTAVLDEKTLRSKAISMVKSFANAYHDSPKARAELKEIIDRKRARIPVIERIRTDAYYTARYWQLNGKGKSAEQTKAAVEGQNLPTRRSQRSLCERGTTMMTLYLKSTSW